MMQMFMDQRGLRQGWATAHIAPSTQVMAAHAPAHGGEWVVKCFMGSFHFDVGFLDRGLPDPDLIVHAACLFSSSGGDRFGALGDE